MDWPKSVITGEAGVPPSQRSKRRRGDLEPMATRSPHTLHPTCHVQIITVVIPSRANQLPLMTEKISRKKEKSTRTEKQPLKKTQDPAARAATATSSNTVTGRHKGRGKRTGHHTVQDWDGYCVDTPSDTKQRKKRQQEHKTKKKRAQQRQRKTTERGRGEERRGGEEERGERKGGSDENHVSQKQKKTP